MSSQPSDTRAERVRRARASDVTSSGVLGDAAASLRLACFVWIGLWGFGLFMNLVVGPLISPGQPMDDAWPWPAAPVAFALIAVSAGLVALTRERNLPSTQLLDLALGYEVLLAFGIGLVNQWTPNTVGLSWICVMILVHPLIVPATTGRAFLAGVIAASMDPVGLAITAARGVEVPPVSTIVWTYLPNYICAVLAVLPARVRYRLEQSRQVERELGSYRLGELIGKGGMGEVYRAEHRMLARPAAVKLVRPELLGASDLSRRQRLAARFEREAQVTAKLRSPHTVSVYDYGITDDGTFYYVMELLEGVTLETLVQEYGPAPAARAVHILAQVCDSLAEAHEAGLVHRDIKPANVYLCRYGRRADFVKVLDFGLAKPMDRDDDTASTAGASITQGFALAGTPAFMAPEQAMGGEMGPYTDIYAVGCVAYWLLTGQLVFGGRSAMEIIAHHAKDRAPAPSAATELEVPAALDDVIMQCLEKDPAKRPRSAEELARCLRAACPEEWGRERAWRWWERHRPEA